MMSAQDDLIQQILGQNLTSKWTGGHGPQDAARDMAKLMADAGITDIRQFGKVPVYDKAETQLRFQGNLVRQDEDGNYYALVPSGVDSEGGTYHVRQNVDKSQLQPIYGKTVNTLDGETTVSNFEAIDPSQIVMKNGVPSYKIWDTFGNKETGQAINRGSGRWEGQGGDNLFSGTGSGKGNTGYRVQFAPDGTPIFYTTEGSSSDLGSIAPLLAIASFVPGLQPLAMAANAAIAVHQGDALGALAGAAGLGGFTDVANAARMGKALQSGDPLSILMSGANMGGVTDVGGVNLGDVSKGIGAAKAIQSGDPLAMLRYGMGVFSKGDSLASSIGPGDMDTFRDDLIPGYFQPGGEGYIAPGETATGPGYYDEITGEFISDPLGGLQGPLGPETGNFDPNQKWEYSLTRPGVWTNDQGEEIDLSYMPDRDTAMTGAELMKRAGAMPGGSKAGAKSAGPGAKIAGAVGSALAGAGALGAGTAGSTGGTSQGQSSYEALLNLMGSNNQLANIKSNEDLFGSGIFASPQKPEPQNEEQDNVSDAEQGSAEDNFFSGGHVDDITVDDLLQILRR